MYGSGVAEDSSNVFYGSVYMLRQATSALLRAGVNNSSPHVALNISAASENMAKAKIIERKKTIAKKKARKACNLI